MGYGELEKKIKLASKLYNNIFFHKVVSNNELLSYTASADIGVALIENICLSYNFCMPNKLFEYAMATLPVVVSNVKEMSAFVEKHQMGVTVMNNTVEDFSYVIDKLLRMDFNTLSQNSRKAALENSWEHQEAKMKIVYQNLLKNIKI